MNKEAYPFGISTVEDLAKPEYDTEKWLGVLGFIYADKKGYYDRQNLIESATKEWDDDEKEAFKFWMKYYVNGEHKKYDVTPEVFAMQKKADDSFMNRLPSLQTQTQTEIYDLPKFKEKASKRIDSLYKMITDYYNTLNKDTARSLLRELTNLKAVVLEIPEQLTTATIRDVITRVGEVLQKNNIKEGKNAIDEMLKDADLHSKTIVKEGSTAGIAKEKLEEVYVVLGQRKLIREIQKVILLLDKAGMAGSYPELDSVQSKLIQSYSSASETVGDILEKMRTLEEYQTQKTLVQQKKKVTFNPQRLEFVQKGV